MLEIKTIKIDREVYSELRKRIQGFSDTPNSVLRRVFNIDTLSQGRISERQITRGITNSKNIQGRIEGDRQRQRLKQKFGKKIDNYPLLYHAGWPLTGGEIQKYSFGMPLRRFVDQKNKGGLIVFICGKAEVTFFIPCRWIADHLKQANESVGQLKFNIPVAGGKYFWMNKKGGITINCFINKLP